jgi:ribosomal protein S10
MALWTGFPGSIGLPQRSESCPVVRKPLKCRAMSDDFERKLSCRFIIPDEVRKLWEFLFEVSNVDRSCPK